MKVNLILDKTKLVESSNTKLVCNEKDYFDSYSTIKDSIINDKDLSIISYNAPVITWLSKAFSKYPGTSIICKEITFKELLAKKWNISYDIEISDDQVISEKLLDLQIEGGNENIPFSDFICDNFISPQLNLPTVAKSKYVDFINDLVRYHKLRENLPQLFKSIFTFKLRILLKNEPTNIFFELIDKDIDEAYEIISTYRVISSYPEKIQYNCLSESILKRLKEIKPNLTELSIESYIKHSNKYFDSVLPEVKIFFNNLSISDKESVQKCINNTSGLLKEEIEFILERLKEKPELISEDLISQIESKFVSLLPIFSTEISELNELIQPKYPSDFNFLFSIEDAITWAVDEYLPYRYWMDRARLVDEKIINNGIKFSEYYFNNYEFISYQYSNCLYRFIFNNKEIINNTDIIIILILDNFSFRQFNYLESAFNDYHFISQYSTPYVSLLPSETGLSKFSLISGLRDKIDSKTSGYELTIKNTWGSYFPNHKLSYLSRIGDLVNYVINSKEIIFINYIEIDKELHKSYEKTAREHKDFIKFYISGITATVSKFCKKNNVENRAKVFFVSDHGSTLINKKIPNGIDTKDFKNFKFDVSHRFLGLEDKEFFFLKDNLNLQDSLHFLNKMVSGDGNNYVIAKGYNRFIDISDEFFVHGGVSPEEVIVPTGYFEYNSLTTKSIILQLKKTDYRLLVKDMSRWRVANPNPEAINNIFIESSIDDEILFQHSIKEIKANGEEEFSKEIRIQDDSAKNIKLNISYRVLNNVHKKECIFPITIKKMVQSKFDFDNF